MDQQRFLEQLQIVLDPAKGNVKAATSVLQNEFYKQPDSLAFLLQLVISHDSPALKQLAAVEAKPLVKKYWTQVPDDQRPRARTQLLQATLAESDPKVRHAAARIVAAIAKIDLNDGEWTDLPSFLQRAATSSNKEERVVGTYILFTILETMADVFGERFRDLFALFGNTIRDPESMEVRINTMMALSKMAMKIDEEDDQASVKSFQGVFPSMVQVLKDTIEAGEEDRIMQAFEVFQTLLGCDYQLTSKHFQDLVVLMNGIASNHDLAEDTRVQALSFLMQAVQYRRLKIQGMKISEQLVMSMLQIVTELGDASADDDDITPARSALGLLDSLATQLPPSQVLVPLLKALPQYSAHEDPDYRRAGVLALAMCVEGAPDFISTQMEGIVPIVLRLLEDPEVKVRQAALHTIARLADDVAQDIGKQNTQLMPMLFKNLTAAMQAFQGEESGPTIDIMKAGCSAIDSMVDVMEKDDASPYLAELAPLLQRLFQHPDLKIKALAASALGSLASTVEVAFLPYLDESMHAMQEFATKKENEEELDLRASITDAMGEIAVACGPEKFKPYVGPLMGASEEALSLDHSRLKESTYILFGSLAKVYEEDFGHFLPGVIKALFDCLDQEESEIEVDLGEGATDLVGQEVTIGGRKIKVAAATDDDDEVAEDGTIEDVELDEDDDDWNDLTAIGPIALEKEVAIEVLGDCLANTKIAALPYLEKVVEKILPLIKHEFENIRKATISTLHRAYAALWDLEEESGAMKKWEAGLPLKTVPPAKLKKFGEILMETTIEVWAQESDRATVMDTSRSLAENLKETGPSLVSDPDTLEKVVVIVQALITKKHPCQQDFEEEEEVDLSDVETTEFEWLVVDSAMDVISALAIALGSSFTPIWKKFDKHIIKYASGSEALERATAVGVLAEVISGMRAAITPFTSQLGQLLLRRLTDEDAQTKSNAAYAVGRLIEYSEDNATITKAYPPILERVQNLFTLEQGRCRDNAAGCISRLILKNRSLVSVADILPELLINSGIVPLSEDYDENTPLWNMIVELYSSQDQTIIQLTPKLLPAIQSVLGEPEEQLDDETREKVQRLAGFLKQKMAA